MLFDGEIFCTFILRKQDRDVGVAKTLGTKGIDGKFDIRLRLINPENRYVFRHKNSFV